MNLLTLYVLLLKATLTSFSGLSSLPVVHRDLVVERRVLSERQLNTSVAMARATPGPLGLYVVCVGYFVGGYPGAVAGGLAMITPAFLIVPLLRYLGRRKDDARLQGAIRAVTVAAAGLMLAASLPLARDAITAPWLALIALGSCAALVATRVDTLWVVACAALAGLLYSAIG